MKRMSNFVALAIATSIVAIVSLFVDLIGENLLEVLIIGIAIFVLKIDLQRNYAERHLIQSLKNEKDKQEQE